MLVSVVIMIAFEHVSYRSRVNMMKVLVWFYCYLGRRMLRACLLTGEGPTSVGTPKLHTDIGTKSCIIVIWLT